MISSYTTLGSQIAHLCNFVGNADGIEVFVRSSNGFDLFYSIVKVEALTIGSSFTKDIVVTISSVRIVGTHVQVVVCHITTAHTVGWVTICYKYDKGCSITAYCHLVR